MPPTACDLRQRWYGGEVQLGAHKPLTQKDSAGDGPPNRGELDLDSPRLLQGDAAKPKRQSQGFQVLSVKKKVCGGEKKTRNDLLKSVFLKKGSTTIFRKL